MNYDVWSNTKIEHKYNVLHPSNIWSKRYLLSNMPFNDRARLNYTKMDSGKIDYRFENTSYVKTQNEFLWLSKTTVANLNTKIATNEFPCLKRPPKAK